MDEMELLHEELRRAREQAGLSQQALADRAGIPRNQIVRAERGENITVDTLRRIAAHLPVKELTLLETKGLRVDIIPEPEKLFIAALENVMRLAHALHGAVRLATEARTAVEAAHRAGSQAGSGPPSGAGVDPLLLLRGLDRLASEIEELGKEAKIAS